MDTPTAQHNPTMGPRLFAKDRQTTGGPAVRHNALP